MRRVVLGLAIGVLIGFSGVQAFDYFTATFKAADLAKLQAEPAESWATVQRFHIPDVAGGMDPVAFIDIELFRPLLVRGVVSSRNLNTGAELCTGSTLVVGYEIGPVMAEAPLYRLARLRGCAFDQGTYQTALTLSLVDQSTGIEKRLSVDSNPFHVLDTRR